MRDQKLLMLNYMKGYRCLGPECEDICCQGWRIPLEREDVARLEGLRAESPLVDAVLDQAIIPDPDKKYPALMGFAANGHCHFEQGGLCALHAKFGEHILPKTCATYPRMVLRQDQHYLLSGSLSCPEVARLCLLQEQAMDLTAANWADLPLRMELVDDHSAQSTMSLVQSLREAILALLSDPSRPLARSIYLVAYLTRKLDALLASEQAFLQRAGSLIAKMLDPSHQEKLLRNLVEMPDPYLPRLFLGFVLAARSNHTNSARYNSLVASVVKGFDAPLTIMIESALAQLWPAYLARAQALTERYEKRITLYLRNYSLNYWQQQRIGQAGKPSVEVRQFALSFAVVKFLILGHPDTAELSQCDGNDPAAVAKLDQVAVEAVQTFSRNISHNAGMLAYLSERMEKGGLLDVADLYSLLSL